MKKIFFEKKHKVCTTPFYTGITPPAPYLTQKALYYNGVTP